MSLDLDIHIADSAILMSTSHAQICLLQHLFLLPTRGPFEPTMALQRFVTCVTRPVSADHRAQLCSNLSGQISLQEACDMKDQVQCGKIRIIGTSFRKKADQILLRTSMYAYEMGPTAQMHMSSRQNTLHGLSTNQGIIVFLGEGAYRFTVFHDHVAIRR